jgi:hypothetical protein
VLQTLPLLQQLQTLPLPGFSPLLLQLQSLLLPQPLPLQPQLLLLQLWHPQSTQHLAGLAASVAATKPL